MLTLKIDFSGLSGGAIWALAVAQVYLVGHETPIRARKGSGLAEISAMQGVAPPEACRRVSLEIDFSGLRGRAIWALAVAQVYLVGQLEVQVDLELEVQVQVGQSGIRSTEMAETENLDLIPKVTDFQDVSGQDTAFHLLSAGHTS